MSINNKFINDSFCVMPWISLRNYVGDYYTICCYSSLKIKENKNTERDSEKFWNSKELRRLRKDMLGGVKNSYCDFCWKDEMNKVRSNRKNFNEAYAHKISDLRAGTNSDGYLINKPTILDISVGSTCDFSCRMCEIPNTKNKKILKKDNLLQKKLLSKAKIVDKKHFKENIFPFLKDIEIINIAGGEPTIIKNTQYFLEKCKEGGYSKNISIRIVTNFHSCSEDFLKLLLFFKKRNLDISIDGTKDLYEYIRYPGKWKRIEKNFTKLNHILREINICVVVTVQIYNVFNIDEIVEFVNRMGKKINIKIFLYLNFLHKPSFFSVVNLPTELKRKAISKLKKMIHDYNDQDIRIELNKLINFIKSNNRDSIRGDFVKYTSYFDEERGQSCQDYLDNNIVKWIKGGV